MAERLFDRAIVIVLDSVGCGAAPDAADYGDAGADTLGHIRDATGVRLPALGALGLEHLVPGIGGGDGPPGGAFGTMLPRSAGKDTTTGHWELAGVVSERPFPTYPDGFPPEVLAPFRRESGHEVLGNEPASGTEIIARLGAEHVRTGALIVYTSADSVFQVAAHEEVVPVPELYRICEAARRILDGPHRVGRVIARPFVGDAEAGFRRTENRRDFSVPPPPGTLPEALTAARHEVVAVGKIEDIFCGRGITRALHTKSNAAGTEATRELLAAHGGEALLFVNLVDFDMLYGHRRDPEGYAAALREFDEALPGLLDLLGPRDVLFLTADHGNDPLHAGTDHTRERVPLLAAGPTVRPAPLGERATFADLGRTIAENFGVRVADGASFLGLLRHG